MAAKRKTKREGSEASSSAPLGFEGKLWLAADVEHPNDVGERPDDVGERPDDVGGHPDVVGEHLDDVGERPMRAAL